MSYNEFLHSKFVQTPESGFTVREEDLSPALMKMQFGREAEALCRELGLDYYIKDSLRLEIEGGCVT